MLESNLLKFRFLVCELTVDLYADGLYRAFSAYAADV